MKFLCKATQVHSLMQIDELHKPNEDYEYCVEWCN